jgi:Tfp pilus assembly protein PilW
MLVVQNRNSRPPRRGLTLTELLVAGTVMTLIAGGMAMLVTAVHATGSYCRGQSVAVQHGRVTLERLQHSVRSATANDQFPGCLVVATTVSGNRFPDTLIVWLPIGTAADPAGLPRVRELVIYTPDPSAPNRLLEIRPASSNTSVVPAATNSSSWATLVNTLVAAQTSTKTLLTDRVRTASLASSTGSTTSSSLRGCVRFLLLSSPTDAELASYRTGSLAWSDLSWPLNLYGTQTGVRRVACQTEVQILPGDSTASQSALPFFGSAVLTYQVNR